MKSFLGDSCNKSNGASYNTNKLILYNQSDMKRHFAFRHYFQFCQSLNTILLFAKHGLLIADDTFNVHKVLGI